jgi:transposase
MKQPIPPLQETPEALKRLLTAERDAQRQQRLQALSRLQTQQARTRRQVARLLGVRRHTVGRWLAADKTGGVPQMLTIAKAPGQGPLLSEARREALCRRLAEPGGFASYHAIWPWLRQEYGVPIAYKTAPRVVRSTLRATRKVPRNSPLKKPCTSPKLSGAFFASAAGQAHRGPVATSTSG